MDAEAVLRGLKARGLDATLDELGDLGRRAAEGERLRLPLVTLHLRSGREVHGHVRDVSRRGHEAAVLVHVPGPDRHPLWDVLHVAAASIEAITLRDVPSFSLPPPSAGPAPTRLETKRRVAALEAALKTAQVPATCEVTWEEEPERLRALDALVVELTTLLPALAQDPLGLEALSTKVQRLQLSVGAEGHAALVERTLVLVATVPPARAFAGDALRKAVEAVL